jgi:hypothetical protein
MYNEGSISESIVAVAAKLIMLLILLCLPSLLFAQTRGTVVIDKDSKVDSLIGNYLLGNKTNPAAPGGGGAVGSSDGFRVQIFSGSDRKEAYNAQAKFQVTHPDMHAYLSYKEPNFKVHVGDFRSRLEAEKVVDELKNSYTGLFIIPEKINASKISSE